MKRSSTFVILGTSLFLTAAATATPPDATEPIPSSAVSSTIGNSGDPYCVDGQEVQVKTLIITYRDESGATHEVEQARWQEGAGKTCSAAKTRGIEPERVTGTQLEAEAKAGKAKARGGPCYCRFRTYWWEGCLYSRVFDCHWIYCWTDRVYCR